MESWRHCTKILGEKRTESYEMVSAITAPGIDLSSTPFGVIPTDVNVFFFVHHFVVDNVVRSQKNIQLRIFGNPLSQREKILFKL